MKAEEKHRIAIETLTEALENDNSSLLVALGKKHAVIQVTGSPVKISKLLLESMKEETSLRAIIMAVAEIYKKEEEMDHKALDCENCEKQGDCPVEKEMSNTNDLLSMLSSLTGKEYKA